MKYLLLGLLALAGAAITLQSAVNSQLKTAVPHVLWAVFISYVGGSLVAGVLLLLNQAPPLTLPAMARVPWYGWAGGLLGVGYVLTITWSLKRVGAANLFALVVAGQLVAALLLDQMGWLGLQRSPFSLTKVAGAVLLVGGAYLINRP